MSFELEGLDLSAFVLPDHAEEAHGGSGGTTRGRVLYNLQGMVTHKGSLNTGHYIAYVSTPAAGADGVVRQQWLRCDDEHVTAVSASEVQAAEAYILFYAKQETAGGIC